MISKKIMKITAFNDYESVQGAGSYPVESQVSLTGINLF